MDLTDPTRALTPTLDGPVLAVLAQSGRPLTVGQIAAQAARGSEIGIRRSVTRLVGQGLVKATQMGRNQVHELNRDHVAAPAADLLASLRLELWKRLRETLGGWRPLPVYACAFGSAARGDGGLDGDIDVLLVHQPFPGEKPPRKRPADLAERTIRLATDMRAVRMTVSEAETWEAQVDDLRTSVQRWTGNPLQALELNYWQWTRQATVDQALFTEIDRDAIPLVGTPLPRPAKVP